MRRDLGKTKELLNSALADKKALEAKYDSHLSKFNAEKEEESE